MNYQELLDRADYNGETNFKAPTKAPNKKLPKSGVQSDGVKRFLEKKKAEEMAKAAEAKKQKEQLLALRAQNSKNNKKAKIMASRTKDNDFSRIRLTEDEIESKKKIESEIQRKHLSDKKQRMKIRIDLEEKEKMLPRKRKRKSKNAMMEEEMQREEQIKRDAKDSRDSERNSEHKSQRPPPPPTSYMDLLKLAETKMHEPIIIPKKKKEEERLLTKKERKLFEEERERQKRKQERLERGDSLSSYKTAPPPPTAPAKHSSVNKKGPAPEKMNGKASLPMPTTKNSTNTDQSGKFKIPKQSVQPERKNGLNTVDKAKLSSSSSSKTSIAPKPHTNHNREPISKNPVPVEKKQLKLPAREESRPVSKQPVPVKVPKKKPKISLPPPPPPAPAPVVPQLDTAALAAAIAKQVKEDLEKEMEAKYAAKFQSMLQKSNEAAKPKAPVKLKPSNSEGKMLPPMNGTARPHAQTLVPKRDPGKVPSSKPVMKVQKSAGPPPPPAKKQFHINPYLDPPRRRLEPVRPQKPQKRRIESDDEDDDMSDFIDDGPSQNDEDYSKYIKEIFGYDRNRYLDEDDDDIMETSFAEQMKEETRSAKLGFLEDLEEERKLREQEKKWKQKHKK